MLSVWKDVTPATLFTFWGQWKSLFFVVLGSISLLGGTPGASQAALDDQVRSQVDFLIAFGCPGGAHLYLDAILERRLILNQLEGVPTLDL